MPTEEQTYRTFIKAKLVSIEEQTKKTNGRVSKLERNMLIIGTATAVVLILKFPDLIGLIKLI